MKNIFVIFKREYLTRVKNKTFILMTFLAPLLMVGFYAATIYIATETGDDNRSKTVYLTDYNPTLMLSNNPPANYVFLPAPSNEDSAIADVKSGESGLYLIDELKLTSFISIFILDKNGNTH